MSGDDYRDPARNIDERPAHGDERDEQAVRTEDLEAIGTAAADLTADLLLMGRVAEDPSATAGRALAADGFATGRALSDAAELWGTQEQALREGLRHVAEHLGTSVTITTTLEQAIAEGLRLNSGITGL